MRDIQILIFSKDRPLQLDGTLRSLSRHCQDVQSNPVRVLWTASTSRNRSLYYQLVREHPVVYFVEEFDFSRDTRYLLGLATFVLFLVDDCLFVGDFELSGLADILAWRQDAIGVSLRLGRNTTYCYALDQPQRLPPLQEISESLLECRWPDADHDFGYPLEVSSSLYRTADLIPLLAQFSFQNPNTLEAELSNHATQLRYSHPVLLYPSQSLAFCAPVNLVQEVCGNRSGQRPEMSAAELAEKFAAGWRIDVSQFDGFVPSGCHQEVEMPLRLEASAIPWVSVIMPCYKQAQYLSEAVNSVVAQTYPDWELIIVDDGSPDNTASTAAAIIAEHEDREIKLLSKPNGGVSEARNAGIRMAHGAYILPLDADDMILPTMLERTVQVLESNPVIDIAYTDITHFGTVNRTIQAAEFDANKIVINNQLNYCSLYRREAWERCGGYKTMTFGYEDWGFWVSCTAYGSRAARVPESLLLYRVKEESRDTNAVKYDGELRARIVLNHPQLYPPERVAEAQTLLTEHPDTLPPGAPMVSVIIPTHNRPELLCDALRSVLAQTMQEFEVIVVNDAGVDVRPWVRSVEDSGRIRILQNALNQGLSAARNIGIRASRGKYIAYLDDDDQFYPHHLAVLVEAAETSGLALVYSDGCQALHYDCDGQTVIERSLVYPGNFELGDLLVLNQFPVNCVLHLRSCIDKVGGFDESLGSHEDWDMWVRLFHNFEYSHLRQTTCEYRIQRGRVSITNTKRLDFYHTMKTIHRRYLRLSPSRSTTRKLQNQALRTLSSELYRSGKPVEPWDKLRFMLRREDAALRAKGMIKRMLSLVRHGL